MKRYLNSIWMLVTVCIVFFFAVVIQESFRLPLGWDEITYIAQTSIHSSPILMPPNHSRGVGLLAAPITSWTASVTILRTWMAFLSAVGLFLSFLAWKGLRPMWVLSLAALLFSSMSVVQIYGSQVMSDLWEAIVALATVGIFIQAIQGKMRSKVVLPLLLGLVFFLVLFRVQDAIFVLMPMLVYAAWKHHRVLIAMAGGLALGVIEWCIEAVVWYGGVTSRVAMGAHEPPKLALYFSLPYQLRVLDGPPYCPPGACHGVIYPWLSIWWIIFLMLVVMGAVAGRRQIATLTLLTCATTSLAGYAFFVPYAAPRYILPTLSLLVILAADGIRLITREAKIVSIAAVAVFFLTGIVTQHFVLNQEYKSLNYGPSGWVIMTNDLHTYGIKPPCLVSQTPIAYYLGCYANGYVNKESIRQIVIARFPPKGTGRWKKVSLTGTKFVAWIQSVKR